MDTPPLIEACHHGYISRVKSMVGNGANVESSNKYGQSCLMVACEGGHSEIVRYLIKAGADVNRRSRGRTALLACMHTMNVDCLKILAENGVQVDFTSDELICFLISIETAHVPIIELVIALPWRSRARKVSALELIGVVCVDEFRDLESAYKYWSLSLEERGKAEPSYQLRPKTQKSYVAFNNAKEFQTVEDLDRIALSDEDMHMQALILRGKILKYYPYISLHYTALRAQPYITAGNYEVGIALWLHAFDLQLTIPWPLYNNDENPLQSLLQAFTTMPLTSIRCENVLTTFTNACETVRFVMQNDLFDRYNFNHPDFSNYLNLVLRCIGLLAQLQPLMSKLENERFFLLLHEIVQLNPFDRVYAFLIHLACSLKHPSYPSYQVVELLLEAGFDPKATDVYGDSPLHYVARSLASVGPPDNHRLIQLLLTSGARCHQRNAQGKSFIQCLPPHMIDDVQYCTLKYLSASAVLRYNIPYQSILPDQLADYIKFL